MLFYSGQLVEKASDGYDFTKNDYFIVDESDALMLDRAIEFHGLW